MIINKQLHNMQQQSMRRTVHRYKYKLNKDVVPPPKRATTAYIHFTQWYREELKRSGREIPEIGEFGKECAAKWNAMNEEQKEPFLDSAARDRERYKREMSIYKPLRDDNKPQRPGTAFMIFMADFRKEMAGKEPEGGVAAMAKLGSERWRGMTDDDKQPYVEQQLEAKLRYEHSMEEYRRTCWSDLKAQVKEKARLIKIESEKTGGGPAKCKNLTEIEERVAALIGNTMIDGIEGATESSITVKHKQIQEMPLSQKIYPEFTGDHSIPSSSSSSHNESSATKFDTNMPSTSFHTNMPSTSFHTNMPSTSFHTNIPSTSLPPPTEVNLNTSSSYSPKSKIRPKHTLIRLHPYKENGKHISKSTPSTTQNTQSNTEHSSCTLTPRTSHSQKQTKHSRRRNVLELHGDGIIEIQKENSETLKNQTATLTILANSINKQTEIFEQMAQTQKGILKAIEDQTSAIKEMNQNVKELLVSMII